MNTVVSYDGKTIQRSKARYIKGQYYEVNVSCFKVDGKWHRINNGLVCYDYEKKKWTRKDDKLKYGIVGVENNELVMGHYTPNEFKNLTVRDTYDRSAALFKETECIDEATALKAGYIPCLHNDHFYKKVNVSTQVNQLLQTKSKGSYDRAFNITYGANEDNQTFNIIKEVHESESNKILYDRDVQKFAGLLGDLTFGLEYETSKGYLPIRNLYRMGLVPLRDGSINGHEFTSIPMQGARGLQLVKMQSEELTKRCAIDRKCSFHIHFGNFKTDKMSVIALYMLCYALQDEMFKLTQPYKKDPARYIGIEKNYCKMLTSLGLMGNKICKTDDKEEFEKLVDVNYNELFKFLSCGLPMDARYNRNAFVHPAGRNKWDIKSRYYWVNLVPTVFYKSRTAEFRLHHGTLNPQKVLNWMYICAAIVRYSQLYTREIIENPKGLTLDKVLDAYRTNFHRTGREVKEGVFMADYLQAYIKERKKFFEDAFVRSDYVVASEYLEDGDYKFIYNGVANFI